MTPNENWLVATLFLFAIVTVWLWFRSDYWKLDAELARDSEKFWRDRYNEWVKRATKNAHEAGKANAKIRAAIDALTEED